MQRHDTHEQPFEVVFVCTGNRARSPLAEALFRRYSDGRACAASYGTMDLGPVPPLSHALAEASRLGIDLSGHRARALGRASVSSADLVLGFEPFHVAAAVVDGGADAGRTFLLGEFVALLDQPREGAHPRDRVREVSAALASRRHRLRPDGAFALVGDPIGKGPDFMSRTADEIDALVRQLVFGLFGGARNGPRPGSRTDSG